MSRADAGEESAPKRVVRTVTPPYWGRRDVEMDVIGSGYFLRLVILLVPLLPFAILLCLIGKVLDAASGRGE